MTVGPGERWGNYWLDERVAVGGMAEVFRARRVGARGFAREVCVKRMLPHLGEDPELVALFLDEARTGSKLRHRNIVAIDELGAHEGRYFLAMEYVRGADLGRLTAALRARGEHLSPALAVYVAREALAGLSAAHGARDPDDGTPLRVVHRDVSPENILLSFEGEVKLTDFGIARSTLRTRGTSDGVVRGRYGYMPLEQLSGEPVDARADLFALGVVLYELLAGAHPFHPAHGEPTVESIVAAQVTDRRAPLSARCPGLSPALCACVESLLAPDPAARPASADAARASLEEVSERGGSASELAAVMARAFGARTGQAREGAQEGAQEGARVSDPSAVTRTAWRGVEEEPPSNDPVARGATEPDARAVRGWARGVRGGVVTVIVALGGAGLAWAVAGRHENTPMEPPADRAPTLVEAARDATVIREEAGVTEREAAPPSAGERPRDPRDRATDERPRTVRNARGATRPTESPGGRGVLRVVVTPFGRVSIDGAPPSEEFSNGRDFTVPAGEHRVRVSGPVEDTATVTVTPGAVAVVRFHGG